MQANAEDCASALTDVYTTEGSALEVTRAELSLCSGIDRAQFPESVRGTVLLGENAPGVGTVVAVRVRPEIGQRQSEDGRGRIAGLLEATVLYMPGGSDLPASAQAEMPFSIDVPSPISDESWIAVEVVSAEANALMSDRLEMKTMLNVCCETRQRSAHGGAGRRRGRAGSEAAGHRDPLAVRGRGRLGHRQALRHPGGQRDVRRNASGGAGQADRTQALSLRTAAISRTICFAEDREASAA